MSYVEILMKYYQRALQITTDSLSKASATDATRTNSNHKKMAVLRGEVHPDELESFAKVVDDDYKEEMIHASSDWADPCTKLIGPDRIAYYYSLLGSKFPRCHSIFATIVSTAKVKISVGCLQGSEPVEVEASAEELHHKQHKILHCFFALLGIRS